MSHVGSQRGRHYCAETTVSFQYKSLGWGGGDTRENVSVVGVYCWDSKTLSLYQTTFRSILQTYSRLNAKNPNPIPE